VEHLKGAPLGYALALPANISLSWKGLLQISVNYGRKKFYCTGPRLSSHGTLFKQEEGETEEEDSRVGTDINDLNHDDDVDVDDDIDDDDDDEDKLTIDMKAETSKTDAKTDPARLTNELRDEETSATKD
jgi:hypothetical protein